MFLRIAIGAVFLFVLAAATRYVRGQAERSSLVGRGVAVAVRDTASGERGRPHRGRLPDDAHALEEPGPSASPLQAPAVASAAEPRPQTGRDEQAIRGEVEQLLAMAQELEREDVVVVEPQSFAGRVIDAEDGAPLPGVLVSRDGKPLCATDEDGRFVVELGPEASPPLAFHSESHALAFAHPTPARTAGAGAEVAGAPTETAGPQASPGVPSPPTAGTPAVAPAQPAASTPVEDEWSIALSRGAGLRAELRDGGGQPMAGARLCVSARAADLEQARSGQPAAQPNPFRAADPRWEARADALGRVVVENLPVGVPLHLSIWEPGAEPQLALAPTPGSQPGSGTQLPLGCVMVPERPLVLRAGEERSVEWRLPQPRLVAQADPPTGDRSTLLPAALPDRGAQGDPAAEPPGSDDPGQGITIPVSFSAAEVDEPGSETVSRGEISLAGRVVDEAGTPQSGLLILARRAGTSAPERATTDQEGRFAYRGLEPGSWELEVLVDARTVDASTGAADARWAGSRFGPFEVAPSGAAHPAGRAASARGLELVMHRRLALRGNVVDELGQPVRARVDLLARGEMASRLATLETDEDGRFEIGELIPRIYDLVASDERGRFASAFDLAPLPGADHPHPLLELRPGATLSLSYREGTLIQRAVVVQAGHAILSADLRKQTQQVLAVPAGELEVHLYEGARRVARTALTVAPGETARVEL